MTSQARQCDEERVPMWRCPEGCVWPDDGRNGRICSKHDHRLAERVEYVPLERLDASYEAGFQDGYAKACEPKPWSPLAQWAESYDGRA